MSRSAILAVGLLATATAAAAFDDTPDAFQVVVAGQRYGSSGFQQLFLGAGYRSTWTTPVRVPVLDLDALGGLHPTKTGIGMSTHYLRFVSGDGRRFRFREVDKDTTKVVPADLRDTVAEWVIQDQIGSSYPAAAPVVDELRRALGMLHVARTLYVMPDDPRLGEFRQQFKGVLGTLEETPRLQPPVTPGFEDVGEILDTEELLARMNGSADERIDVGEYLKCRMLDIVTGDWDRHPGQWNWVKRAGHADWIPYVKDTDQAFSNYDGLIPSLARRGLPSTVSFEPGHRDILGYSWNSRELDRRVLGGAQRAAYEQAAAGLQRDLTDASIEAAVRRVPPDYYSVGGAELTAKLKARRDLLADSARRLYELLADKVEVYATDRADVVEIDRRERADGIEVRVTQPGRAEPYYRRRLLQSETSEVRIFLAGGDDRVVTQGRASGIEVRVVGGPGDDLVDDSEGGGTRFYDDTGRDQVVAGPGTHFDRRAYEQRHDSRGYRQLDWGGFTFVLPDLSYNSDLGFVAGAKVDLIRYGFRNDPWASRHQLGAVYATGRQGGRFEYLGQWQPSNSARRLGLFARVSQIEIVRFYGFGNQSANTGNEDFYKSDQRQYLLEPAFRLGLRGVDVWIGPRLKYQKTDLDPATFLGIAQPYGTGEFGQAGASLKIAADTRGRVDGLGRGVRVAAAGNYYPKAWDVQSGFGEVHGEVAGYLHVLALRAGGKKVWGTYPFHEAAFLGGPTTLRSASRERYAGDASVFGSAEVRLPLVRFNLLMPVRAGLFGLADVGRVYVGGSSTGGWHKGFGGGAWFSFIKPENTLTIAAAADPDAQGDDGRTRLYIQAGFAF